MLRLKLSNYDGRNDPPEAAQRPAPRQAEERCNDRRHPGGAAAQDRPRRRDSRTQSCQGTAATLRGGLNSEGEPWREDRAGYNGFIWSFKKAKAEARPASADLRGTVVTRLALAGCTFPENWPSPATATTEAYPRIWNQCVSRGSQIGEAIHFSAWRLPGGPPRCAYPGMLPNLPRSSPQETIPRQCHFVEGLRRGDDERIRRGLIA